MFNKLIFYFNRKLWLRVVVPVSVIVMLVVGANFWFTITFQTEMGEKLIDNQNKMLTSAVEGGMFDALAVGDNDTVRNQFKRLNEKIKDLKVYVYDFNGVVSFSTDESFIGKDVSGLISREAASNLSAVLETGQSGGKSFRLSMDGKPFLMETEPILNEQRCYHCHGSKRNVLGGISVFSSEAVVRQAIGKGRWVSVLIGVAGLVVIMFFVWTFFHFMVNKKVAMVLEAMARMRQKDFTHTYDVGKGDEMNHILARINMVTQDLRGTIGKVVENSDIIFKSASDLSHIAKSLNDTSSDASEKSSAVSAAAEEMSSNNQSIADAMEQSTQSLNTIASAIEEMSATVGEIAKNVSASKEISQEVAEGFDMISQVVDELGQRANDVDIVTDEIRSISEQVSMLALNAKIEAARAGEAGKGFAVVAQEITELAHDTSQSTLEADEKLRWIKEKATDVITKVTGLAVIVKESENAISSISAAVEEQNVTTSEIAKSINTVSSEISDVNNNVMQGAAAAAEIAKEITVVDQGSKQVGHNSNRLNDNAASLSAMAGQFMELMKKFKV